MATLELSESEAVQALLDATQGVTAPKGAKTVREFARITKLSETAIRDRIGSLAMQDRIEVKRVQITRIDGTRHWAPGYIILPPKGKGGRKK